MRGQPAIPIHINPQGAFSLGCELGWRHYHIVLRDLSGALLGEHRRKYDYPHAATIFEEVGSVARLLINQIPAEYRHRLIGMGLATPSTLARNLDLLGVPADEQLAWANTDVVESMQKALDLQVFRFNDGDAACWGELVAMPAPRPTEMLYVTIGTFVGSGLIADGHLWEGRNGGAANLGAMIVGDGTHQPRHVHMVSSLYALEKLLAVAGIAWPPGPPAQWDWQALEPVASQWLEDAGQWLAMAIANARAIAEFEIVIVDGVLPEAIADRLMTRIQHCLAALPKLTMDYPQIARGTLGNSAAAMGAALMPIYRRFFSRKAADAGL